jgi:hypothetical protein
MGMLVANRRCRLRSGSRTLDVANAVAFAGERGVTVAVAITVTVPVAVGGRARPCRCA